MPRIIDDAATATLMACFRLLLGEENINRRDNVAKSDNADIKLIFCHNRACRRRHQTNMFRDTSRALAMTSMIMA